MEHDHDHVAPDEPVTDGPVELPEPNALERYRKIIGGTVVAAVVYALTELGIDLSSEAEKALNVILPLIAVYLLRNDE